MLSRQCGRVICTNCSRFQPPITCASSNPETEREAFARVTERTEESQRNLHHFQQSQQQQHLSRSSSRKNSAAAASGRRPLNDAASPSAATSSAAAQQQRHADDVSAADDSPSSLPSSSSSAAASSSPSSFWSPAPETSPDAPRRICLECRCELAAAQRGIPLHSVRRFIQERLESIGEPAPDAGKGLTASAWFNRSDDCDDDDNDDSDR